MSHVIVANESDMEFGIDLATALAVSDHKHKNLEISFPSEGLMCIFLQNLYEEFIVNSVPFSHGLDLKLNIPADDMDDELGELLE